MQKGDFIKIDYVGRLESGEIFDLTDEELAKKEKVYSPKIRYRPVPIIVGAGFVIPGLEKALLEMKLNEKRTVEIKPENGFGMRDPKLVKVVPRNAFKGDFEPRQGLIVDFSGIKGRIQSVSAGRVMVDFNNPMAGKNLRYDLEIRDKIDDPVKQAESIFDFFGIEGINVKIDKDVVDIEAKNLPVELKEKISSLIIEYVKGTDKVRFIETYGKAK
jgi:FKBP-type peptidyl-prolyl cis-trans isomerase 2